MANQSTGRLFPPPKSIRVDAGSFFLRPASLTLSSQVNAACAESFCRGYSLKSEQLQQTVIGNSGPAVLLLPAANGRRGWKLSIEAGGIRVEAEHPESFQYAGTMLAQLFSIHGQEIPSTHIEDEPTFPVRGVMLDISRDKVPTMATLFELVDTLASWRINHLQLYIEHTFAYGNHRAIWEGCSPITAGEIRHLDDYCRMLNIELAANQNSFGHLQRWLQHPEYIHLAEAPGGYVTPWGEKRDRPFSLNPLDPASLEFLSGLYDELLPNFSSALFNVGCDETFDLGQGASRQACEAVGRGRVYLDFLKQIKRLVEQRGKTMLFWGDIILHYPDLVHELGRDLVALVWGYEAGHPFAEQCSRFADSGVPFWVCPGTSNWNSIAGRLTNALANMDAAAREGAKHGASGFLITEWGDNGHWQTMPFMMLGLGAGAFASWHGRAPTREELADLFPGAGSAVEMADVYRDAGFEIENFSPLFHMIRYVDPSRSLDLWTETALRATQEHLENITRRVKTMQTSSGAANDLLAKEMDLAGAMLLHALKRGFWIKAGKPAVQAAALAGDIDHILDTFKSLWTARNREGGLTDSIVPLVMRRQEYATT